MSLPQIESATLSSTHARATDQRFALANGRHAHYRHDGREARVTVDGALAFVVTGSEGRAQLCDLAPELDFAAGAGALAVVFACEPGLQSALLRAHGSRLERELLAAGLAHATDASGGRELVTTRDLLFQHAPLFLPLLPQLAPLAYCVSDGKRHPRRAVKRSGVLYSRYLPRARSTVSFRTLAGDADLELFHRWMNEPRVAAFWELAGTRDAHAEYLEQLARDAHNLPVFGCFDGEPFGYFELYFCKEDRVAPFYDAGDYDRGLHMLVGEARFRGPAWVAAWLPSLTHFLFLDDPRTTRVVAEPRHDNARMITYLEQASFLREKTFDFPHKRAALMVATRERFFQSCPL